MWFPRFNSGDFNMKDKERPVQPKSCNKELEALLVEVSRQTLEELCIPQVLHLLSMIRK